MATAGSGLKLSKADRKMMKKQNKALHTLIKKGKEVGEISNVPTPFLLVKNGGLMCEVKRQDLVNVFGKYGKLEDLVMLPGKSYSYALFSDVTGARNAMENINGKKISNQTVLCGRIFYLVYLMKRPCVQLCLSDKSYPPGMVLIEDFISECQEGELMQCFSSCKESNLDVKIPVEQQLKHRYVKHYGYEFIYGSNNIDKNKPLLNGIPNECLPIVEKLVLLDCVKHEPDQLTINEYQPGQGIPPHVDTHSAFEDGIISLSLGAQVAMDFRHPDGRHVSALLPRRSVLIMTGESRYVWTHGITPRRYDVVNECDITIGKDTHSTAPHLSNPSSTITLLPREVRLSLTFRKVRRTPCCCKYPAVCDSQNYSSDRHWKQETENSNLGSVGKNFNSVPQSEEDAVNLEKEHVHDVYENIAEHFSGTRHSPWPKIAAFLKEQPPGSVVADVGCGNGKYMGINDQLFMCGSDRSQNLAAICRERGYQVIVCDILSLPYRSNSFDVCICIAVIHHLSTPARRLAAIEELSRIVRPGGRILISVWALEQNLKDTRKKAKSPGHSGKSSNQTDSNSSAITNKIENEDRDHDSKISEKESFCNSNVGTTTTGSDASFVTSDVVLSKEELCSDHIEDGDSLDTLESSSHSNNELVGTLEIQQTPSDTSSQSNTSGMEDQMCIQISQSEMERSRKSSWQECTDHTVELKVNASRDDFEQQDLLIPWHYRGQKCSTKGCAKSRFDKEGGNEDEQLNSAEDGNIPKVFQRFYHVFKESELADECTKLGNVSVVRCYYDKGNWCVELEKPTDT